MHEQGSSPGYVTSLLAGRAYALADQPVRKRENALEELTEIAGHAGDTVQTLAHAEARVRALALHPCGDRRARHALALLTTARYRAGGGCEGRRRDFLGTAIPGGAATRLEGLRCG